MKRIFQQTCMLFLALVLLTTSLPLSSYSINVEQKQQDYQTTANDFVTTTENFNETDVKENFVPDISFEDVSKRGEFEKHYLLSDGSFLAVTYPEAIHYLDETGEWMEVDNTLSLVASAGRITTANEEFQVSFAEKAQSQDMVSMQKGDHKFSWSLTVQKADRKALVSEKLAEQSATILHTEPMTEDEFTVDGISSGLRYSSLFASAPEISVDYSIFHNKIEEDIYINSPTNIRSISMCVTAPTLDAILKKDGSVEFVDSDGVLQYRVGIPYMVDAAHEVLNDIVVTVEQVKSLHIITYTPDEAWLTSSEREYPILLDPSITTKEYNSNITDTYVKQDDVANHSAENSLYYGVKSSKVHRIFFKINNLPDIDPTMPIVEAVATFYFLSGTTTGKTAALYRVPTPIDLSTITYANMPLITTFLSSCNYNSSNNYMSFDMTANFSAMLTQGLSNYGYMIRYGDETLTNPDYNVFFSTEYTTASKRPVITVKYGYELPPSLTEGDIYSFQNVGSGAFMTVHNGTDANDVNVYQQSVSSTSNLGAQHKFKLEYVSSSGGYYLRSLASSDGTNRVLDIYKINGYVSNGSNVQIYAPNDPLAQHWFIIGTGISTFKIVPRTDMSLALTVYPGGDGSSSGTTSTSVGNIFVATYDDTNDYQKWMIRDSQGSMMSGSYQNIQNDTYYLNNSYYGRYLRKYDDTAVDAVSGLISTYEEKIRWKITHIGNGHYTIQSSDDLTRFLYSGSSTSVSLVTTNSITSNYLWTISNASGGGVLVQNVATGSYLKQTGTSSVSVRSSLGSSGTADYKKCTWRLPDANNYSDDGTGYYDELPADYKFKTLTLFAGETKSPELQDEFENVLWGAAKEFTYSGYNTSYVTHNSSTGAFTASSSTSLYSTTITATHRVTGRTTTFSLVINPKAVLVGVTNTGHNHSSALTSVSPIIRSFGYSSSTVSTGAFTILDIDTLLDSDSNSVFVSRSHGGIRMSANDEQIGTHILLNNEEPKVRYRSYQSISTLDLTNMELIMFIACSTGAGGKGGKNLPTVAVEQGAKTAVGFEDNVDCDDANNWTIDFFNLIEDGMSVKAACDQLREGDYANTGLASPVICGYEYTRLN